MRRVDPERRLQHTVRRRHHGQRLVRSHEKRAARVRRHERHVGRAHQHGLAAGVLERVHDAGEGMARLVGFVPALGAV